MQIPFTIEQFLNVFKNYNQNIFPVQIIFYLLAILSIYLIFKHAKHSDKIISAVLTLFWLWIGVVYHLIFFTKINKAAYLFAIFFIIQGVAFFIYGIIKQELIFGADKNIYGYSGIAFIIYALLVYPILSHLLGHQYPYSPTFGLPCPTTIFTFGVLLLTKNKLPLLVLIIPFIWSLIGFSAALNLSVYEDFGLLIAGILGLPLIIMKNKKYQRN